MFVTTKADLLVREFSMGLVNSSSDFPPCIPFPVVYFYAPPDVPMFYFRTCAAACVE